MRDLTRYYVHGDSREGRAGEYYCARCDSFQPKDHFNDSDHVRARVARYGSSLRAWERLRDLKGARFRRPPNAVNILAKVVAADNRTAKLDRSPFYRWLLRQADRDDPIGDFATDAARDVTFPSNETDVEIVRAYLFRKQASSESLVAFDESWSEFKRKSVRRAAISVTLRMDIFRRDSFRCRLCGRTPEEDGIKIELDHIKPVSKGGANRAENLRTLCFECNRGKGAREL